MPVWLQVVIPIGVALIGFMGVQLLILTNRQNKIDASLENRLDLNTFKTAMDAFKVAMDAFNDANTAQHGELSEKIDRVAAETKAELKAEIKSDIAELKAEIKSDMTELREMISDLTIKR